jgi:hypothetical protein
MAVQSDRSCATADAASSYNTGATAAFAAAHSSAAAHSPFSPDTTAVSNIAASYSSASRVAKRQRVSHNQIKSLFALPADGSSQTIKKRHLRRLQFASGNFVGEEARLIDFWKLLVFARARRPFQFEQI